MSCWNIFQFRYILLIILMYIINIFISVNYICFFQITWCVARTSSSTGYMNPLVYNRILVNEGNAWIPGSNTVRIPYTGYYLVHYGVGVPAWTRVNHHLYSSGTTVTVLYRDSTVHNGVDTQSKTIIRRFIAGSVLKITGGRTYSNSHMQTIFAGLLLYEG